MTLSVWGKLLRPRATAIDPFLHLVICVFSLYHPSQQSQTQHAYQITPQSHNTIKNVTTNDTAAPSLHASNFSPYPPAPKHASHTKYPPHVRLSGKRVTTATIRTSRLQIPTVAVNFPTHRARKGRARTLSSYSSNRRPTTYLYIFPRMAQHRPVHLLSRDSRQLKEIRNREHAPPSGRGEIET